MPQIAMIQTAAPQAPPPAHPANNDTQSFSPHLDKAMAGRKDQPANRESLTRTDHQKAHQAENRPAATNPEKTLENSTDKPPAQEQATPPADNISGTALEDQTDIQMLSVPGQPLANTSPVFEFLTNTFAKKIENTGGQQVATTQNVSLNSSAGNLFSTPLAETMNAATTMNATMAGPEPSALLALPSGKPENNALLLELQKIIENSNESGILTITATDKTRKAQSGRSNLEPAMVESEPLPIAITSANFSESDADAPMVVLPAGAELPADKANQNLNSIRHSLRQQYYEGKIAPENEQQSQTPSEGSRQDNTFSAKNAQAAKENPASAIGPNQTNTFTQPLVLVQEGQKPTTGEGLPPVTLPSGTVVQQEDVIRQIAERFQLSRRDIDTRINIQLHPAELGELKIGLSVKEGSIRANVVASSQYAQEIIEKNMVKLRTVLESQGFTIGEISVTCKSDTPGDFNLFERQLFSQNDYTPPSLKNNRTPAALFTMEDPNAEEQAAVTGVNVKI